MPLLNGVKLDNIFKDTLYYYLSNVSGIECDNFHSNKEVELLNTKGNRPSDGSVDYIGTVPFNLRSRLLAPTEREYVPLARTHD